MFTKPWPRIALLVMSNLLRVAYDEGRCRDVLALYDLTNLEKKFPVEVGEFIEREQEITRTAVEGLKAALKAANPAAASAVLGYRLLTVWLPLVPGLLVLGVLIRRKAL